MNPFKSKKAEYVKQDPLVVSLQLNGNALSFRTDLTPGGKWKTQTDSTRQDEEQITTLQRELQRMHKDMKHLEDEKLAVLEEKYLLEFKNQLLLEMVAVSQLDAKKNVDDLEREKLKTEALKWELANLNIEQSQQQEEELG
tara:strand:+ start:41 stop:463 length:423 start_codon:yes stop_codon:yes gene_type:complete